MPSSQSMWDPAQYRKFQAERSRPFFDLVARVPDGEVRTVADLGCGTGELTRTLVARWPAAEVWGVDNSAEMLATARAERALPALHFVQGDIATWEPPRPLDVIISNAALQWVPDHASLVPRLVSHLAPGGVLAVQMPRNYEETAFRIRDEMLATARWGEAAAAAPERFAVEAPVWYAERLLGLGLEADVWEAIYYHRLAGPDGIVEWMKGTAFRPLLRLLGEEEQEAFLAEYAARVGAAYATGPHGTWFPFRRLFLLAARPRDPR